MPMSPSKRQTRTTRKAVAWPLLAALILARTDNQPALLLIRSAWEPMASYLETEIGESGSIADTLRDARNAALIEAASESDVVSDEPGASTTYATLLRQEKWPMATLVLGERAGLQLLMDTVHAASSGGQSLPL